MKTGKNRKCTLLMGLTFLTVSFLIGAGQAGAEENEIFNNSKDTIEFYVDAERGNVWFEKGPCGTMKNGPCLLPPGTRTDVKFTTTNGRGHGFMNVFCKTCKDAKWVKIGYTAKYWGVTSYDNSGEFKGGMATGFEGADLMYRMNSPSSGNIVVRVQLKGNAP